MKVYADAGYLSYLLDLFEGNLSLSDLLDTDISLIMSMRESKEEQIKIRAKNVKRLSSPKSSISNNNAKGLDDIVASRGGFTNPI